MPDAIDARLASLVLSDVDIGEFDQSRTDYHGAVAEGVTETTVAAEALQRRTDVDIDPPDTDVAADGHQVALEGLTEITVTVTSPDGSRERVYRITIQPRVTEVELGPTWTSFEWPGADALGVTDALREAGIMEETLVVYHWDEAARRWIGFFPSLEDVPGLNTLATLTPGCDLLGRPSRSRSLGRFPWPGHPSRANPSLTAAGCKDAPCTDQGRGTEAYAGASRRGFELSGIGSRLTAALNFLWVALRTRAPRRTGRIPFRTSPSLCRHSSGRRSASRLPTGGADWPSKPPPEADESRLGFVIAERPCRCSCGCEKRRYRPDRSQPCEFRPLPCLVEAMRLPQE